MMLQTGILFLALLGLSSALVCPDGGMCEDKNTCCQNSVGGYGCCPLPHAECCSDHLHCCFERTVCDLVHSRCVNKTVSLPWMERVAAKRAPLVPQLAQRVKAIICGDQESECPDDTTCCQLLDGSWGCCPLAKAVCCEDKLHCCPEGTKCDIAHSKCVSSSLASIPMLKKLPARRRENNPVGSVTCPGGKSSCPDSFTCCLLTTGDYGCCPYPQATCCNDHLHCCPSNTICDLEHGVCKSVEMSLPLLKIVAVPNDVECPDKKTSCPDQTTCCQMIDGTFGCCPMPNAVCCSDRIHCCPEGTECDVSHSACVSAAGRASVAAAVTVTAAATKLVVIQSKAAAVPCNDSVACADGSTCCKSSGGEWACCPLPKAQCCEDHQHCCPHGTVCNLSASTCDDSSGSAVTPWLSKVPAFPLRADNGKCDEKTSCPDKSTCCKTEGGDWACCPLPQAVCCEDHLHCCPQGTVCNLEADTCDDPAGVLPSLRWVEKVAALTSQVEVEKWFPCDDKTSCPEKSTCCKEEGGDWACCPLPQAVCCEDHLHCCPQGTVCNIKADSCDDPAGVLPSLRWVEKVAALTSQVEAATLLKCDEKKSCPDKSTCCKTETGDWACCPLPQAVCCEDHLHCCPQGTVCNLKADTCDDPAGVLPSLRWVEKVAALTSQVEAAKWFPCDDKTSCPEKSTCCKEEGGDWACCPLPQAVCCEDHLHCCPQGTVCNIKADSCDDPAGVLPSLRWVEKVAALTSQVEAATLLKCDEKKSCPDKSTCCKTETGDWACCPLPQAVCCEDHLHCCPQGTVCNLEADTCDDPAGVLPSLRWVEKVAALTSQVEVEKCDKQTMCPGGTTCCRKDSGQWACCPLPQAVCCNDHEHCCPKDYKCNMAEQTCDQPGRLSLPWLKKIPALQPEAVSSPTRPDRNMCDAQTSCPKDTTCCFMDKSHQWGCCPLPKAVCCDDGNHCCPSGHTCEPHRSSCSRGPHVVIPWFTKLSARTEPGAVTDVKCDDKSSCASGTTCCKLQTGEWGCCPLVKAVCCADHEHCCPQGYSCNMQTGTCEKKSHDVLVLTLPQSKVVRSEVRDAAASEDAPCGAVGEFRCPTQETCCKVSATEWACCPSPRAVCCADSKHCCPAGYSCDLKAGGCTLNPRLTWDTLVRDRKKDFVQRGL